MMGPIPRAGLAAAAIWLGFAAAGIAAPAHAPAPGPAAAPAADPAPAGSGEATLIPANGRPIALEIGGGTLIRLPRAASTVFVANPDIADVQVKAPTLVYLTAKSPGQTVIYAVDANDQVLLNAAVRVAFDLSQFRRSLNQLVPGNAIRVSQVDSNLVLSGAVASAGQAQKAATLAAAITGGVKSAKIVNRLSVVTPNQVDLRVRIAEVNVSVLNEIGVNWQKLSSSLSFMTNNPVSVAGELTNMLRAGSITGTGTSATISALEQEGFITDLAEPNLVAMSGQTASFLAGGEFPVPIAGTASATGFPTITVEFQTYGVQLAFTPTVIDANHLNLRVRPEVSELTTTGEVSVPLTATATVTIPALTVRRADTTVELGSGQSFALAGLLQHTSTQLISKVPWIGDIPILGALFRSNRFQRGETDLVVIVTPYLVKPAATRLAAPTDGLVLPHDVQQVLWGDTWQQSLPGPARGPLGAGGAGLIGPAGFRLN